MLAWGGADGRRWRIICGRLARGDTISNAPEELVEIILLQHFPGYTRETLRRESAEFVGMMWAYVAAQNHEAARQAKAAKNKRR